MKRRIVLPAACSILFAACGDTRLVGKPVVDETTNGFQARLVLPDGSPAARARVAIASSWRLADDTDGVSIKLDSDADGMVRIPSLADGEYWLEATGTDDGIRFRFRPSPNARDTSWQLRPFGSIEGTTRPYARIRVYGSRRSWMADERGMFKLDHLSPGRWNIRIDPPGSDSILAEASMDLAAGTIDSAGFSAAEATDLSTWKSVFLHIVRPDPGAAADSLPAFTLPVRIDRRAFEAGLRSPDQLRILNSSREPVPFGIESWNTAAQVAEVWATLPAVHPRRGDTLFLAWGKTGAKGSPVPTAPESVHGVWHLGGVDPLAEATGKGPSIHSDTATSDAPGLIGRARLMERHSAMRLSPPSSESFDKAFTVSCWVLLDSAQHNHAKIFDLGPSGPPYGTALFDIDSATGRPALQLAFADGTWRRVVAKTPPSGWTHLAATWDGIGRVASLYMDGLLVDTLEGATGLNPYLGHELILGNQETGDDGMAGRLDEFRLDLAVRSAAWIRHSWHSQRPEASTLSPSR